jgi:aminoglycoside phosphotransferase (APT) family kinase protein
VFRFPRRRAVAGLIAREIALLPLLAPQLPVAISAPEYVGTPTPEYPWPFAGYAAVAGTTACAAPLSDAARAALAPQLGAFLRALHAVDPAPLVARGLPTDEIGRLDHATCMERLRDRLPTIAAAGYDAKALRARLDASPPVAAPPAALRVVHGDLYGRHLVLDAALRLAGVIDWGDLHFGDPALDLAVAHLVLPPAAHAAFRAAYGAIDERAWNAARYRALYHALLELDYGVRADDAGMRALGETALRLIRGPDVPVVQ